LHGAGVQGPLVADLGHALVNDSITAALLGLVFTLVEGLRPARSGQRRLRPQLVVDLAYFYLAIVLSMILDLSFVATLVDRTKETGAGATIARVNALVAALPVPVAMFAAVVVADFSGYWKHRLFHTKLFWPFHAVHHSSEDLDWLSNERVHPVELVVANVFQLAPLALLGFRPETIAFAILFRRTYSIYEHSNVRLSYGTLRYVLVSPHFHRWHHAADAEIVDRNYANVFAFWDLAFGTYHVPERPEPSAYGIAGFPTDLVGQTLQPFRELLPGKWREGHRPKAS
jgi:sterol desaturase/sphingolipid hydroxylase (fatty acid hydroxylase superfamily)